MNEPRTSKQGSVIDGLEQLLQRESTAQVNIRPDGSVQTLPSAEQSIPKRELSELWQWLIDLANESSPYDSQMLMKAASIVGDRLPDEPSGAPSIIVSDHGYWCAKHDRWEMHEDGATVFDSAEDARKYMRYGHILKGEIRAAATKEVITERRAVDPKPTGAELIGGTTVGASCESAAPSLPCIFRAGCDTPNFCRGVQRCTGRDAERAAPETNEGQS